MILVLGAAAAVVLLVIAGIVVFAAGEDSAGGSPTAGAAVRGYLEALARGDAAAALSFSDATVPDRALLTDDILKKQIEKYPITDIRILSDIGNTVHVVAEFGGKKSDQKMTLPQPAEGDGWKLESAAMTVDFGKNELTSDTMLPFVTVFGHPVPKTGKAYAFPGWLDLGSSNPNFDVKPVNEEPPSLEQIWRMSDVAGVHFDVSTAGVEAVRNALKVMFDKCAESKQLAPPDCPQDTGSRADLVDGTAQWTAPTDYADISTGFLDSATGIASFDGEVEFTVSVQTTSGQPDHGQIGEYVYGDVDLTQAPPTIKLEN
ncbi:hypothetical protein [Mycolicibacterium baixiangningiae]|uniref:hypothetical protein n=1 Tax=Mycolicibacterium baixiangningiae TaxID=2761578 RepID=UPI0018661884|nr:hypothetical protein [Mycolicibacterium baixiangningiae]